MLQQLVSAWSVEKATYIYGDPGNVKDLWAGLILGNISKKRDFDNEYLDFDQGKLPVEFMPVFVPFDWI